MGRRCEDALPATYGQERLWILAQLDPGVPLCQLGWWFRVRGPVDPDRLDRAAAVVLGRHEALRTGFALRDGGVAASVDDRARARVAYTDLTAMPDADRAAEFDRIAASAVAAPFALDRPPLWRLHLVRLTADDVRLIQVVHRIVGDRESAAVLAAELTAGLTPRLAAPTGRPALGPVPGHRATWYARLERSRAAAGDFTEQLRYWRATLADLPTETGLPADRPRPAWPSFRAGHVDLRLPADLAGRVAATADRAGTGQFEVLLAAFGALLHRYTGQPDVVVGTSVSTRDTLVTADPGSTEPAGTRGGPVGAFDNTLVLRTDLGGDPTFTAALDRVCRTVRGALDNRAVPYPKVVEAVATDRDLSRPSIYQIGFGLAGAPSMGATPIPAAATHLDLDVRLVPESDGGLCAGFCYATDLFDASTVRRLASAYRTLLESAVADPDRALSDLRVLDEEAAEHGVTLAGPARAYPGETLAGAILEQAAHWPQAPAVYAAGSWLSYRELADRAARTARWLRRAGVGPDRVVGVFLRRGPELLPTLLGVLAAGGAYLPLEPEHPATRLERMISDADARLVVTTTALAGLLPPVDGVEVRRLDAEAAAIEAEDPTPPRCPAGSDSLAYVMFTSGSTGWPRGAGISHRAVLNRLYWMQEELPIDQGDRVLHKTPYSFDVSVWELFWPLLVGAGVVVAAPGGHHNPGYLAQLVDQERVTVAHFVPSQLAAFLDHPELLGLDRVICSGEVLSPQLATRCFERLPGVRLYNLYGPTEATIDVSWHRCVPGERSVPIGRPVANTRLEVLDQRLRRVPPGAVGELCIGGDQLARCYVGRPALTAARFVPDPYGPPGARLYRTGDLARWRGDGELEFLGRDDDQVKIRGVRIEPGEIRAALERHLNVDRAVVAFRPDAPGGPGLVAYVRWTGEPGSLADALRSHLGTRLPRSMLPAAYVSVSDFPLLPSGKLDLAALPPPERTDPPVTGYVAARTTMERVLCGIWADLLRRPDIGIADDFFAMGGDSLLAAALIDRVRGAFGVELPLRTCFELRTVSEYALAILDLQLQQTGYDIDDLIEALQTGR